MPNPTHQEIIDAQLARQWAETGDSAVRLEQWQPIPGWEDSHEISSTGRVRTKTRRVVAKNGVSRQVRGRELVVSSRPNGYQFVALWRDNKPHQISIHRAVLSAFDRLPNQGEVGMHLDDDPTNNSIENLRWGTTSDNVRDCSAKRRHNKSRNDHCPQGHALAAPNLDPYQLNRGVRMCVACQKAHRYIRRRPHLKPELKRISDGYFDAIAGGEA